MGEEKGLVPKEPTGVVSFSAKEGLARVDEVIEFVEGLRKRLKPKEDYNKHPGYKKEALEKCILLQVHLLVQLFQSKVDFMGISSAVTNCTTNITVDIPTKGKHCSISFSPKVQF